MAVPVQRDGKTVWVAPQKGEFVSRDTSKSYYDKTVRQTSTGRIAEVGSYAEAREEAKAQAEREAEIQRQEVQQQQLQAEEKQKALQEIEQKKAERGVEILQQIAYQKKIEEAGGVEIRGDETAQEIKRLSKASGIPEKEIAQAVEKQAFKQEVVTSLLEKQAKYRSENVPEYVKEEARKTFTEDPQAVAVTIKVSEGTFTFERGETRTVYEGSGATISSAETFALGSRRKTAELMEPDSKGQQNLKEIELFLKEKRGKTTSGSLKTAGYSVLVGATKSTSEIIKHPIKEGLRLGAYTLLYATTGGAGVVAGAMGETLFTPGRREAISYQLQTRPGQFVAETVGGTIPYVVVGGLVMKGVKTTGKIYSTVKGAKTQQVTTTYEPQKVHVGKTSVSYRTKADLKPGVKTTYHRGYTGYTYGEKAPTVTVGKVKATVGGKGAEGGVVGLDKTRYINLQTKKYHIQAKQTPGLKTDPKAKVSYMGYITKAKYISKSTGKVVKTETIFTKEPFRPDLKDTVTSKSVEGVNWRKLLKTDQYTYREGFKVKGDRFKQTVESIKQTSVGKSRQFDTASNYKLLQQTYQLEGKPSIYYEIKQPEIVYSKSPTYKPNIYEVKPLSEKSIQTTKVKEPTLYTVSKSKGITKTIYEAETFIKPLGKKAEVQLGGTTQRIEKVKVLTPDRSLKVKGEVGILRIGEVESLIEGVPKTDLRLISLPSYKLDTEIETETKTKPKILTDVTIKPETKSDIRVDTDILTDVKTDTLTDTKAETISRSKTKAILETETITETIPTIDIIKTPTPKQPTPFIEITPPPPPSPNIPYYFYRYF